MQGVSRMSGIAASVRLPQPVKSALPTSADVRARLRRHEAHERVTAGLPKLRVHFPLTCRSADPRLVSHGIWGEILGGGERAGPLAPMAMGVAVVVSSTCTCRVDPGGRSVDHDLSDRTVMGQVAAGATA